MLTKKDLELLDEVIQKAVKAGFDDFYENVFLPHSERSEAFIELSDKRHREILKRFDQNDKDHEETLEYIKDHEKRIRKVESITSN